MTAFPLFASSSRWGWLAFRATLAMRYLVFRVTGIPAAEAQGDDYRRYQGATSAFVPRRAHESAAGVEAGDARCRP
jgi:steroid 5-alpha reductase family enzyme